MRPAIRQVLFASARLYIESDAMLRHLKTASPDARLCCSLGERQAMRRLFVLAIFAAVFTTVSSAAAPLDMKLELVPAVALPGIPVGLHVTFERAEAKCRRSVRRST